MRRPIDSTGFHAPTQRPLGNERRSVVLAELIATLALAICTMVAATVLTVGIARAGVASTDHPAASQMRPATMVMRVSGAPIIK